MQKLLDVLAVGKTVAFSHDGHIMKGIIGQYDTEKLEWANITITHKNGNLVHKVDTYQVEFADEIKLFVLV